MCEAGGLSCKQHFGDTAQCVVLAETTDSVTGTLRIATDTLPKMQKEAGRGFQH